MIASATCANLDAAAGLNFPAPSGDNPIVTIASLLRAPLPAIVVGWVFAQTPIGAEIFVHRDEQGITHFSDVPGDPRWVPLQVPTSIRKHPLNGRHQEYPFARLIGAQALQHGIDAALIRAVIKVESNFDPLARSQKGAVGLMQLLPQTARRYGVFDLYEPNENIRAGVRHLKLLMAKFRNDVRLSLAAYNAGAGAVTKHGGVPPFPETIEYIGRVLRHYQRYRTVNAPEPAPKPSQSGAGETPSRDAIHRSNSAYGEP